MCRYFRINLHQVHQLAVTLNSSPSLSQPAGAASSYIVCKSYHLPHTLTSVGAAGPLFALAWDWTALSVLILPRMIQSIFSKMSSYSIESTKSTFALFRIFLCCSRINFMPRPLCLMSSICTLCTDGRKMSENWKDSNYCLLSFYSSRLIHTNPRATLCTAVVLQVPLAVRITCWKSDFRAQ